MKSKTRNPIPLKKKKLLESTDLLGNHFPKLHRY